MDKRQQLEQAIAVQESLRGSVDDSIIDATIATLREKLAALEPVPQQRKQVTVLFMDIAGHTALTRGLDPEKQMAVVDPAIARMAAKIDEYSGRVARYQGDGFKAVFGLPTAQENDPAQAIRAGLAIQAEANAIAEELKEAHGLPGFQVRVGIATGMVFSGGETEGQDTIKGPPVNLAARLESAAEPGTVLIAHDSYKHVRGIFDFEPLDPIQAKGFPEPVQVYRVLRAKPHPFYRGMRGVEGVETRMVGREVEFLQLQKILQEVIAEGERMMVTVVGEAGLGKSRLLYEFENWVDLLPEDIQFYKGRAQLETRHLPYGLLRDLFAIRFQITDDDRAEVVREKLRAGFQEALGVDEQSEMKSHIIAQLLGYDFSQSPHLENILEHPKQLRDQAFLNLVDYFQIVSSQEPVLILLEDLHWADDSSLDALNRLALGMSEIPVLFLGTARPGLYEKRPNWMEGQPFHMRLDLRSLSKWDSRRLVEEVLQKFDDIPATLRELVVANAEGNPFYVEELVKMLVEDGVIIRDEPHWRVEQEKLVEVHVPPTLTGVLQARLDSLPMDEREVLQGASVVGRTFWDKVLEHINHSANLPISERGIADVLEDLRSRELVFRRETSTFADTREHIFKHTLLREVTYESVLIGVRKTYHAIVAKWLVEHAGDREGEFTGLIADHLELAGKETEALRYLTKAGEEAAAKYANEEAIRFFNRALELLKALPVSPERAQRELALHMGLGPPLIATRGFGAAVVERTYARAKELAGQTGQSDLLFHATWGQWVHYNQVVDLDTAQELVVHLFHFADQLGDEGLLLEAHHSGWTTEFTRGDAAVAEEHFKKGLEIYIPEVHHAHIRLQGHDPGVCAWGTGAINLWLLGYPDKARQRAIRGFALGQELKHPFSSAFGIWGILVTYHFRGERAEAVERAQESLPFLREHGFPPFIAQTMLVQGSMLVREGKGTEGMAQIREAQNLVESTGALILWPWVLSEFLEACLATGATEEGLQAIEREKEVHTLTGQRWLEPELRRLYGELLVAHNPNRIQEAEAEFKLAIEIAQRQSAKSLELRAVMSLARLWQKQGKISEALHRLRETYNWFTEGFDTADLKEAKALLEELEG
jgi:class 3 adenylate cyclase/predicted ATPase